MTSFIIYLFEVTVCSVLFAGYYWWVLRDSSFYRWNRLYINASVVLSLVVPLLNITILVSPIALPATYDYVVNYIMVEDTNITTIPAQSEISPISWVKIGLIAYMFVTLTLLVKEFVSFVRIVSLKRHAERIRTNEALLYCINDNTAPFTFFRTIFWKKDISPDSGEGPFMLRHELAHVRLGHSWDKALMQLVCCIFWMNPFFVLLRRELELVHEFEADRESLDNGNAEELSSLILCTMYPNHYHDFTSRFFQSSIKRRIFMITKSKKSKLSIIRKICVIPILFIMLFTFSVNSKKTVTSHSSDTIIEGVKQDVNPWSPQNVLEEQIVIVAHAINEEQVKSTEIKFPDKRKSPPEGVIRYNDVEVKPKFKSENAERDFLKHIADNINYPTIAAEKGISGEVIVSYVVKENGKVEDVEVEVSIDPSLAKEVVRCLDKIPDWIPGKQNGKNVSVQCYIFTKFILQN